MGQEIADRHNPSRQMKVNEDGSIDTNIQNDNSNPIPVINFGQLVTSQHDYVGVTYPDTVTEVYVFKTGGSGGTTVATVTVVYVDSSKELLTSVTKT